MNNSIEPATTKQCCVCQEWKPVSTQFFRTNSSNKTIFRPRCKKCDYLIDTKRFVLLKSSPCPEGYKRCTKCKQIKKADNTCFPYHHNGKNGLYAKCFECTRKLNKQYRDQHIEISIQRSRDYRKLFPQKVNLINKNYVIRNPEKQKSWQKKWNDANRERLRVVGRVNEGQRRARKRALPYDFTDQDYERCMQYWNNSCAITGDKSNVCLDHWIPLANPDCPGTIPSNIIPLTFNLNCSKKDRDPVSWLVWKFGDLRAQEILSNIEKYFQWVEKIDEVRRGFPNV